MFTPKVPEHVGIHYPRAEFGREPYPLDRAKFKALNVNDRNAWIIRRANFFCDVQAPQGTSIRGYIEAKERAKEEKAYSTVRPKTCQVVPLDTLKEWYPKSEYEIWDQDHTPRGRQQLHSDATVLQEQFGKLIERFKKTELYKEVKNLVRPLFQQKQINKIVAFGGAMITTPAYPHNSLTIRCQTQHAALIAMREVWEECNLDPNNPQWYQFQVVAQDPQYSALDEIVLKHYGIQVACADVGYQMGWLKLDEQTLVVDYVTCFPVMQLVREITRPAAMLCAWWLEANFFEEEPIYSYTLKREIEGPNNTKRVESLVVPYLGGSDRAMYAEFLQEYDGYKLNMENLKLGQRKVFVPQPGQPFPPDVPGDDGDSGNCYLGVEPTLYIRKD